MVPEMSFEKSVGTTLNNTVMQTLREIKLYLHNDDRRMRSYKYTCSVIQFICKWCYSYIKPDLSFILYSTVICSNVGMRSFISIALCVVASDFEWHNHNCVFLRIPFFIILHKFHHIIVFYVVHITERNMLFKYSISLIWWQQAKDKKIKI